MVDDPVGDSLTAYTALPAADRRAVGRLLTRDERRQLRETTARLRDAGRSPEHRLDLSFYSPWLSKRLSLLLAAKSEIRLTSTAREALRHALSETGAAR